MLSNKRLVATCAIIFCCNIALLVVFVKYNVGENYYVTINEHQEVITILPDDFLSIGIDASELKASSKIDFSKERFQQLAAALAPARLRLGGTMSERLIFSKDDLPVPHECRKEENSTAFSSALNYVCERKILPFFIMNGKKWTEINKFCKVTKIRLLFTLNDLLRDGNQEWDSRNAKELLEYSKKKKFNIDWQLGNEPNSFHHVFNVSITPEMLAHDFIKLRKLLDDSGYHDSLLIGPDTTRPQPSRPECLRYMEDFLGNVSNHISVRSWHQYYLNSRTATLEDFWNPDTFNLLKKQIVTMKNHTKKFNHIPMWLTETSSSYGGGTPGLSNSYAGSPLWIDKLGLSAKYNITTVIRQSFYGGNYSLIDDQLEPLPDWWLSVLFKKLVGNKVLHVKCHCSRFQRIYAHCVNRKYSNDSTAITIYGINLDMSKARFLLNGTALHGDNLLIDEYIISAPSNNRRAKTVLLNGWPLHYESPSLDFQPRLLKYGNHISMPPYSIGFWVVKNTSIKVCKNKK